MSRRMIAVTVGVLFLVQMVTAIFGTSLIQAFVDGDTNREPMTIGVLLMICSGIAVVGIGLLMYQVLKAVNHRLALWYPVMRVIELTVSTTCGIYLLTQLEVVPNHLLWVYIPTGVGGLILTYLLFVSSLVPRPIAVLGFVGYAALLIGVPLDLLGVLDMNEGPGLVLLAPGGLFEFVFMPIWLLAKGFRSEAHDGPGRRLTTLERAPGSAAL
ncbi:DUF4386 domain-containing protein [Amycolatopsis sp. NPDC051045]|uniref:DUF4386 domain-containing protein n=1 Tax=Amycolatopsis sp. NPDC051045 TaxID=3156922 RepID=UPI0034195CCA